MERLISLSPRSGFKTLGTAMEALMAANKGPLKIQGSR